MKWEMGRQGTGYLKLLLKQGKNFDVYLLKYPVGSMIPPHNDLIVGYEHHRINIILKNAKKGGYFINHFDSGHSTVLRGRVNYFRPDHVKHSVSLVEEGTRYVLSIGWRK